MIYFCDLFGTAVFAFTGALAARRYQMDPFGVIVLALVTAIGGGTLRDAFMGTTPVFWIHEPTYIWVILITVIFSIFYFKKLQGLPLSWLPSCDAFGLALFTVIGTNKALELGCAHIVAIVMGVLSGVGGGMIRDVLCQCIPMVLQKEIYALASMLGAIVYCASYELTWPLWIKLLLAMNCTFLLRIIALKKNLSLPQFKHSELSKL